MKLRITFGVCTIEEQNELYYKGRDSDGSYKE